LTSPTVNQLPVRGTEIPENTVVKIHQVMTFKRETTENVLHRTTAHISHRTICCLTPVRITSESSTSSQILSSRYLKHFNIEQSKQIRQCTFRADSGTASTE